MSNRNADVVVEKALFGWAFCFARRMIAAAVLAMVMFVRADGITLTRTDDEYVVTVESDFVASDATVYLVWGAKGCSWGIAGMGEQARAWSCLSRRRFIPHFR